MSRDVTGAKTSDLHALRATIGLVNQKHKLVPRLSVLSNVIHGLLGHHPGPGHWSHSFAPAPSREAAKAALRKVGLEEFALRRADRLSGGPSHRVAIARAIAGQPELLIADDPFALLHPAPVKTSGTCSSDVSGTRA